MNIPTGFFQLRHSLKRGQRKKSTSTIFLALLLAVVFLLAIIPIAKAESVLYSDNFANLSSWTIVDGTWNIMSGGGAQGSSPSGEALMWAGSKSWTNYQITASVTILAGGEGNIVFRFGDPNNFYYAGMGDWQHQYSISKIFNGVPSEIVGSGVEQSNGAGTYTLMVVAQGNTIKLYVNNVQVLTTTDNTFTFGSVGFRTFASIVQVKSINVLSLPSPLTVSISPPGSFSMDVGQTKTFTATASGGTGTIHYQWLLGTTAVGTDSSSYTYTASGTSASITCKITDSASTPVSLTSNTITISVASTPTVSIAPSGSFAMDVAQTKTFTATASGGSGIIHYQWLVGATAVGTDSSSYTYTASGTSASITCKATDSASTPISSTSNTVTISVAQTPTVSIAPSGSFSMDVGQTKTFTATASGGTGTIHYQWYVGTTVTGTDSSSYTYTASGSSASITCKVTDSASTPVTSLASNAVTITGAVQPTYPSVSVTPGSAALNVGQTKTFTTTASGGSGSYTSYHWYVNETAQSGQTASTFSFSATSAGSYSITATVTDSSGATSAQSNVASVTVDVQTLTISVSPTTASITNGQAATYTITLVGSGGFSQVVSLSASGLPTGVSASFSPVTVTPTTSGVTSTLTVQTSASTPAATSTLTIKGTAGTTEKTATVTLTVNPQDSLVLSVSPTSPTLTSGQTASFIASASGGTLPYTYQWYEDTTAMTGQTSSTLTTTKTTPGTYSYSCKVTDSKSATANSNVVTLTVTPITLQLTISISTITPTVLSNQAATFTASASGGTSPYTYQWYEGTTIMTGQTSSTFTTSKSTVGTYSFSCKVTDSKSATANSSPATLTVNPQSMTLDHFEFDSIGSQKINSAFNVRIIAKDQTDAILLSYNNPGVLSDSSGFIANVTFSDGVCVTQVKLDRAYENDKMIIDSGTKSAESKTFNVIENSSSLSIYLIVVGILISVGVVGGAVTFLKKRKQLPPPPSSYCFS
jgi:hypothetical protein